MCGLLASIHSHHNDASKKSSHGMKIECYPETYAQYSSATEKYHKLKRVFGDVPTCVPSNRLYMEMDVEDLLSNPFNTQPPSLNELIHVTGFNKDWIMFMYRNFKQICSNGRMPLQQWRRIFQLIFPKSANSEFADRVFRAIAGGKTSKHITFEEMDMDNDGIISFDDVKRVLTPECDSMRLFKEAHLLHS
uniref:BMA-NCS-6, isoform d n=1 Tax=Brugia malayi TaxID=6279 RepID=A0A1I9G6S5_BRUMA|nr:BMA-NCS-6, isoform d [Brugia malayi]